MKCGGLDRVGDGSKDSRVRSIVYYTLMQLPFATFSVFIKFRVFPTLHKNLTICSITSYFHPNISLHNFSSMSFPHIVFPSFSFARSRLNVAHNISALVLVAIGFSLALFTSPFYALFIVILLYY